MGYLQNQAVAVMGDLVAATQPKEIVKFMTRTLSAIVQWRNDACDLLNGLIYDLCIALEFLCKNGWL